MATLFSVLSNGIQTDFKKLSQDTGPRYYIDDIQSGPMYQIQKFRAPGWGGNALIRGGFVSERIVLIVRYQDTLANAIAAWRTDKTRWGKYNAAITDGVTVWSRCTMVSSERITDELAYDASGTKWFNVRYVFEAEEQY